MNFQRGLNYLCAEPWVVVLRNLLFSLCVCFFFTCGNEGVGIFSFIRFSFKSCVFLWR